MVAPTISTSWKTTHGWHAYLPGSYMESRNHWRIGGDVILASSQRSAIGLPTPSLGCQANEVVFPQIYTHRQGHSPLEAQGTRTRDEPKFGVPRALRVTKMALGAAWTLKLKGGRRMWRKPVESLWPRSIIRISVEKPSNRFGGIVDSN